MSRAGHADIRIGTLAPIGKGAHYLRQIVNHGFESFELTIGRHIGDLNLAEAAKEINEAIAGKAIISSLGLYGNPLQDEQNASDWKRVIEACSHYGCQVVCGFAGALEDRPVDGSMRTFGRVFGEIAQVAADHGVKIAFENCDMGGTWESPKWNIAHSPRAWEMMFNAVPGDVLGLEWEPCHQMVSLIDPIPQLRQWVKRVYHVHGKDATIGWDVLKREGLRGDSQWVWHRTPGFGDTNWTDIITILRQGGFEGSIDIEGWHDPIYRDELEMTGQVRGLRYLQECRGGTFVANPE